MRTGRWTTAVAVVATALLLSGCGGGGDDEQGAGDGEEMKVGLVTDIGGLNDRSFNHLAHMGLKRGESDLGVAGRVLISRSNADYIPNLSTLAQQDYDLIVGVGFLMEEAIGQAAKQFPETNFAIVDDSANSKGIGGAENVRGLLFREQQGGYLAGYLAGLQVKAQGGKQVVGAVGGQKIPPVDRYIAGFQAGAKAANPDVRVLVDYSQDFVDQAKCKEITLNHIEQGSQVEFQVAGQCGLGVLDAAREKGIWGIGADADQAFLGPHVLTSALKKVDVAVFETIESVKDGSFKGGQDTIFDVASKGIGLGKVSAKVERDRVAKVESILEQLGEGKIKPPETPQ